MAEGESENRLEAEVDVGTERSVANVRALIDVLQQLGTGAGGAGAKVDTATGSLDKHAASAAAAAQQTGALGAAAQQAAAAAQAGGEAAEASAREGAQATRSQTTFVENLARALTALGPAAKAGGDTIEREQKEAATQTRLTADQVYYLTDALNRNSIAAYRLGQDYATMGQRSTRQVKDVVDESSAAERITGRWAGEVTSLVSGYFGMQGVLLIIREIRAASEAALEAQKALAGSARDTEKEMADLLRNLNLPQTEAGQTQARKIVEDIGKVAKGTSNDVIAGIVGSAASFGLRPDRPDDLKVIQDIARTSGQLGLDRDTASDLVKLMKSQGALTPDKTQKFLSQFLVASQNVPVERAAEFGEAFIRVQSLLGAQGVSIEEGAGLFAQAATVDPSAKKAATMVERMSRILEGSENAKTQAEFFKKATEVGKIPEDIRKRFEQAQANWLDAATPQTRAEFEKGERELLDIAKARTDENTKWEETKRRHTRTETDAAGDAQKLEALADQVSSDTRAHQNRIKGITDQETDTRRRMDIAQGEGTEKAMSEAWRAMSRPAQFSAFFEVINRIRREQGPNAEVEIRRFLRTVGATSEETEAFNKAMSEGARQQGEQTRAAIRGVTGSEAATAATRFESGQQAADVEAARQQQLAEADAATAGEREALRFSERAKGQYNIFRKTRPGLMDRGAEIQPRFTTSEAETGLPASETQAQEMFQARMILDEMWAFFSTMTPAEKSGIRWKSADGRNRTAQEIFAECEQDIFDNFDVGLTGAFTADLVNAINRAVRWLGFIKQGVNDFRTKQAEKKGGRAGDPPSGPAAGESATPGQGSTPATTRPTTGPSASADVFGAVNESMNAGTAQVVETVGASARGGPVASAGATYNINIGTLVSSGADELDLVGKLEIGRA